MTEQISRRMLLGRSGRAIAGAAALCAWGGGRATAGGERATVEIWRSFPNAEQEDYFRANFIDAYNELGANRAELTVQQTSTINRQIQTALAAGRGPDVVESTGPALASAYAAAGYLAALDDYVDAFGWPERLQPWAFDTGLIDGRLYSIPRAYSSLTMLYNPATFEANGWTLPTTRAEFEAICADAADRSILAVAAGNADFQAATEWHVTVFLNHVAGPETLYRVLIGELRWTDAAIVESIALLSSYIDNGWYGGGAQSFFTNTEASMFTKLAAGEAAMMITGSWGMNGAAPYFGPEADNDAEWEWAHIPALSDKAPTRLVELGVGGTYSLNARSGVPDEAVELIDFLVSDPRRQALALADVGLSPAPVRLTEADFPASVDPRVQRFYAEFSEAETVGYTTWTFLPPRTNTYLYVEMEKVMVGALGVEDYCAGLEELFSGELAQGIVPVPPRPTGPDS
jgi:raffinose/stachyose/melibiose transport system substrate-binding protein